MDRIIQVMKYLHEDKYDYIIPEKSRSKNDRILILCKKCHSSTAVTFREHLVAKKGCRNCRRRLIQYYNVLQFNFERCKKCQLLIENCVC